MRKKWMEAMGTVAAVILSAGTARSEWGLDVSAGPAVGTERNALDSNVPDVSTFVVQNFLSYMGTTDTQQYFHPGAGIGGALGAHVTILPHVELIGGVEFHRYWSSTDVTIYSVQHDCSGGSCTVGSTATGTRTHALSQNRYAIPLGIRLSAGEGTVRPYVSAGVALHLPGGMHEEVTSDVSTSYGGSYGGSMREHGEWENTVEMGRALGYFGSLGVAYRAPESRVSWTAEVRWSGVSFDVDRLTWTGHGTQTGSYGGGTTHWSSHEVVQFSDELPEDTGVLCDSTYSGSTSTYSCRGSRVQADSSTTYDPNGVATSSSESSFKTARIAPMQAGGVALRLGMSVSF